MRLSKIGISILSGISAIVATKYVTDTALHQTPTSHYPLLIQIIIYAMYILFGMMVGISVYKSTPRVPNKDTKDKTE